MPKNKKSVGGKSPVIQEEVNEKTTSIKNRSYSRPSIKDRVSLRTRSKSRSRKEAETDVKPRSRSKSKSRSLSRSKSRSKSRSRSRSRSLTKLPRPRGRPRLQRGASTTRARGRSKSKTRSNTKNIDTPKIDNLDEAVEKKKLHLVLKNVLREDFPSKESKLNEIIRRSVSRELSQEKASTYRVPIYPTTLKNLKEVELKNIDGINQEISAILPKKKRSFSFSLPDWLNAIIGLLLPPVVVLILHLACNRNQCNVSKFHIPRNWKYYFNLESLEIVTGFLLVQGILSLLPIGKRVDGPPGVNGSLQYRCNGLLSSCLTVVIVAVLWHFKFPVTIVYDKLISLIVVSIGYAYFFGLILFARRKKAPVTGLNPAGIHGSNLHKYYVGCEINPFLWKINVKTLFRRFCLNGMLLLNGLLVLKASEAKHDLSNTLATCVILLALNVVDSFWFEDSFPYTFEAIYEGTGCALSLSYFLFPFLPTLITKFIIQHKIELPVYSLVAIVIGFVIGFVIYRASNLQKATFRKCPLNPALAHFETISTTRGKKLLVAGWWGWVRHPNYFGTMILYWAWASTSGYNHVIPYFVPLIVTIMLMLRAKRVDSFCSQRYQLAWQEYCSRVQYRIFPRVF